MKAIVSLYVVLSLAMIATSIVTGRRATALTGEPHYLLTRSSVLIEQRVEAKNATDAAFDAAFGDAGESTEMSVEEPMFVLGLMDATGPFVLGGGLILLLLWWGIRRRRGQVVRASGVTGQAGGVEL